MKSKTKKTIMANESNLVKLTALWVNETRQGKKYMSGYLGDSRVLMFKNEHKTEDKHPDYVLYVAPKDAKKEVKEETQPATESFDDDMPF